MTSVSTAAQAQVQLNSLKALMAESDTLETQATTGKIATNIAGLGTSALSDLQSNASLTSLTNYDTNITMGQTKLTTMSSAVTQIQTEVNAVVSAMDEQSQQGNADMSSLNALAKNSLSFINNLLNQKQGTDYVFAGADASTPPLGSSDQLNSYTQTQIKNWTSGSMTTDQLIASYEDPTQLTDSTMGYSASLSSGKAGNVSVAADNNDSVDYTTLANDPSFRNAVASLTMLVNLTSAVTSVSATTPPAANAVTAPGATAEDQQTNFYKVFNDLNASLDTASTGMDQIGSKLGYAQATLKTISANHTTDENTLQSTIGNAENVDLTTVATKLSTLQTQLQASYQITASMQKYSLVNYLTTA